MSEMKDQNDTAPERIASYELRREIGRGALSAVYAAQDTRTGQEVALKLLLLPDSLTPEEAGDFAAGFEREAQAAARLSHPNLVVIHEIGAEQGKHFLAMECLPGQTLRKRLNAGKLKPAEAFPVLMQIAAALDAVHQAGMTHRDVKPTSIMLLPDGTAKLLHFGLAQSPGETASARREILVGSPFYLAPEQVKGEGSAAADIWALGVLTCEMLTGRLPFNGPNAGAVMYQVVHQPPASTPELPLAAQSVLRRALDKDPARRYATASAFVQALMLAYPAKQAPAAKQAPVMPEYKPAAVQPKPAERKPAASARPPLPLWLPVASLLVLFVAGAGGMALVRPLLHPAHNASLNSSVARVPIPDAKAPVPTPPILPAPALAASQRQTSPLKHQAASRNVPVPSSALPPVLPVKIAESVQAAPVKQMRKAAPAAPEPPTKASVIQMPAAQQTASVPVQPRRPAAALKPAMFASPARRPELPPVSSRRVVVRVDSYLAHGPLVPAQNPDPVQAEQNAERPVPAQSISAASVQAVTLPAEGEDSDALEADARLRKSAWSQNGSTAMNGETRK